MKLRRLAAVAVIAMVALSGCGRDAEDEGVSRSIVEQAPESDVQVYLPDGTHLSKTRDSKVNVVEFIDYQSPNSGVSHQDMVELSKEYAGRINVQVRNFPQEAVNNNSRIAAQSAEAVRLMDPDLYQPFTRLMLNRQGDWSALDRQSAVEVFAGYVREVHGDEQEFRETVDSPQVKEIVEKDLKDAESLHLASTPTVYINEERITPGTSLKVVFDEVDSLLAG